MDDWEPIPHLTDKAQSLFRQSWEMLKYLHDHPDLDEPTRQAVVDEMWGVEKKIQDLPVTQRYKR